MTKDDPEPLQRLRALREAVRITGAAGRPELAAYVEKVRRCQLPVLSSVNTRMSGCPALPPVSLREVLTTA